MNLVDELHGISAALHGARIPHAICGGVAVTIHGATRSTKHIDILIAPEDVQRALDAIRPLGPEGPLTVVSRETLLRMKRLSGRAQDLADIEKLERADAP